MYIYLADCCKPVPIAVLPIPYPTNDFLLLWAFISSMVELSCVGALYRCETLAQKLTAES